MKITTADLLSAGIPPWDVRKFRIEWPDGAEITEANVARAEELGLVVNSFLTMVLPKNLGKEYEKERLDGFEVPALRWVDEFNNEINRLTKLIDDQRKQANCKTLVKYIKLSMEQREGDD